MQNDIKARQVELVKSVWTVWGYTVGALLFTFLGLIFALVAGTFDDAFPLVFLAVAAAFAGLTVYLWHEVKSNKKALLALRLQAAEQLASEQKGVWPPPPSVP